MKKLPHWPNRGLKIALLVVAAGQSLSLCASENSEAAKPLFELGVGIGSLSSAHYPGSDQSYHHLLPVPYAVYRGDKVQADREGIKAILADNKKLELSLSASAGLPVQSNDNRAREGMPDLGWLVEVGPLLRYLPLETANGTSIQLELPVRAAFSLDNAKLQHRGWTINPTVKLEQEYRQWTLTASVVAMFGNSAFEGYFYDIDTPYVTSERPYFDADPGYTATRLGVAATRRSGNWFFGGFAHAFTLQGAENEHSPLMKKDQNFSAGFMLARVFYRSERKASVGAGE